MFDASAAAFMFPVLFALVFLGIPVSISLLGSGLGAASYLFLGWFGPRGLASILYVLMAVENESLADADVVFAVVMCTVLLSVLLHGLTAAPGAAAYADQVERRRLSHPECAEHAPVEELPVRHPFRA